MIILVINCGSSSIKYQLLDMKSDEVYDLLAKGIVEKIGLPCGNITHKPTGKPRMDKEVHIADHKVGMQLVLDALVDPVHGVLSSFDDIEAVGHRIVQGADFFSGSALVNEDVISKIEICCDFAPLHNPAHLLGIRAVQHVLPSVPQVVTFDTAYHQTMPDYAYMYALPYEYYEKYRVRRYGAHGTSHQFVAFKGAKFVGLDIDHSKIITCHIGNGSSISAIVNGKVVDTSMGFTPLEGMIMGTRCGNVDPNVVPYIMKKENLTPDQMTEIMNRKSGFLGLSGLSSDARDLDAAANAGNYRAKLVFKKLAYDIIKIVGSYIAVMDGVDAIFFTAGIGENNARLRRRVCENFSYMGLKFDFEANVAQGVDTMLSTPDSKVKVALITTDEELVIARDTMRLVMAGEE
ncbi:MAG: acetate kinase [Bacteroidales bacterium]|nr:acetate kinase [Bacteroidales bacterium]MBR4817239.1 acetate kinase [Bacteroidales bacterium]MBR5054543.1 acetate kinase [Bacteroidales bacterium]